MEHDPPKPTGKDTAHTLVRAGISGIPIIGGPAVELFQMLVMPPLETRRQAWMESIGSGLERLEEKQKTVIDDLKSNDVFIDTVLQASQVALRSSHNEKKESLRNAVLNAALPHPPNESRQQMFIHWIDSYTVWHLRLLKLFANPRAWYSENKRQPPEYHITGSLGQLLCDAFPELKDERGFYDKIAKDLYNDGLFGSEYLHVMMSGMGVYEERSTPLSAEFLRFISDPLKD
jgi:hypothetical protein